MDENCGTNNGLKKQWARQRAEQAARVAAQVARAHGSSPLQALTVGEQVRNALAPPTPPLVLPPEIRRATSVESARDYLLRRLPRCTPVSLQRRIATVGR